MRKGSTIYQDDYPLESDSDASEDDGILNHNQEDIYNPEAYAYDTDSEDESSETEEDRESIYKNRKGIDPNVSKKDMKEKQIRKESLKRKTKERRETDSFSDDDMMARIRRRAMILPSDEEDGDEEEEEDDDEEEDEEGSLENEQVHDEYDDSPL